MAQAALQVTWVPAVLVLALNSTRLATIAPPCYHLQACELGLAPDLDAMRG